MMIENKRFKLAFEDYDSWAICDTTGEYSNDEDYIDWLSGQKAVDVLNELNDENKELKARCEEYRKLSIHFEQRNNELISNNTFLEKENEQLKTQIKIFEKFLNENNLDIDWEIFCTVDECKKDSDDYGCKECKYLGGV